jgi:hypothetical protein
MFTPSCSKAVRRQRSSSQPILPIVVYASERAIPSRPAAAVPPGLLRRRRMASGRGMPRRFRRAGAARGNRHGTRCPRSDSPEGRIRSPLDRTVSHWDERVVPRFGSNFWFTIQTLAPSHAAPTGAVPPVGNTPKLVPSLARSLVTVLSPALVIHMLARRTLPHRDCCPRRQFA